MDHHDDPEDESELAPGDGDGPMTEEEEADLAARLREELESLRHQTKAAIESSWAEVERLQLEGTASAERVTDLERELEALQSARADAEARAAAEAQHRAEADRADSAAGRSDAQEVLDDICWDGGSGYNGAFGQQQHYQPQQQQQFHQQQQHNDDEYDNRSTASGGILGAITRAMGGADTDFEIDDGGGAQQQPPQQRGGGGGGRVKRRGSAGFLANAVFGGLDNDEGCDGPTQEQPYHGAGMGSMGGGGGGGRGGKMKRRGSFLPNPIFGGGGGDDDGHGTGHGFGGTPDLRAGVTQAPYPADARRCSDPALRPPPQQSPRRQGGRAKRRSSMFARVETDADHGHPPAAADEFDRGPTPGGQASRETGGPSMGVGAFGFASGVIRADMLSELASVEADKCAVIGELEMKLRGKEAAIEQLECTTQEQARTIHELQAELDGLHRQAEEEEKAARADLGAVRSEIERNEARAAEMEAQVAEAERALEARREREEALLAELAEMEERVRRADEKAAEYVSELEERLRKANASRVKYEEENRSMRRRTDEALDGLRKDLVEFLPPDKPEVLIRDLMEQFANLREKEEALGEVLVARMQERQEVLAAIQKMGEVQKRADMGIAAVTALLDKFRTAVAAMNAEEDEGGAGGSVGSESGSVAGGGAEGRGSPREDAERMRRRHTAAIAGLERAATVQERVRSSLLQVEEELMDRLALLDWNKSQMAGDEDKAKGGAGGAAPPRPTEAQRGDVMERAERAQEEARAQLAEAREVLERELAAIDGDEGAEVRPDAAADEAPCQGAEREEEDLDWLEAELEQRDAKIASLQAAAADHEKTVESLRAELDRLQTSTREESNASLEVMEKLQREVHAIVERVEEKDRMIASLTEILDQKRAAEASLEKELWEVQEEVKAEMPDFPQDLGHVGL